MAGGPLLLLLLATSLAWSVTSQPFTQCPTIGADTGCQYLITFTPSGAGTIVADPNQGPYDGSDDALVGVQNNAGFPIFSFSLSGPDIFGFDGDGLVTFCSNCSNSNDDTGYAGPLNTFNITDSDNGVVIFPGSGLLAGQSTYFSLEGQPTTSSINITSVPTPAPTSPTPTTQSPTTTPGPTTQAPTTTPAPTTLAPTTTCPPCTCNSPAPTTAAPNPTPVATTGNPAPTPAATSQLSPCGDHCNIYSSLPNRCCNAEGTLGICCGFSGCGTVQYLSDGTSIPTCKP